MANIKNNIKNKISEKLATKKHPFACYFIISWLVINWKVVLYLIFDVDKAERKINAITNLFIPQGFCQAGDFSFICWLCSNWNPDNKFLIFGLGLPFLIAFLIIFIINPFLSAWFLRDKKLK